MRRGGCLPQGQSAANEQTPTRSPASFAAETHAGPLKPSDTRVDLGYVAPGGREREVLLLTNRGTEAAQIVEISTSCDCLQARMSSENVPAKGTAPLLVDFDLANDPAFRGPLAIEVHGIGGDGSRLFSLTVTVRVDSAVEDVLSARTSAAP